MKPQLVFRAPPRGCKRTSQEALRPGLLEEAHDAVAHYTDNFYNPRRRHSTNNYLSPMHAELRLAQAMAA
jgi:transposase InsO family protein